MKKSIVLHIVIVFFVCIVHTNKSFGQACTCTTTGASTDWNNAAAWSCAGTGCASTPRVNATWPYDNVVIDHDIEKGGGLVMNGGPGADLTVNARLTITSNNLRLGNWGDASLTINAGGVVDIQAGNMRITGSDAFSNAGTLNAVSLITSGSGTTDFSNTGTINLSSDFTLNSNLDFDMTGGTLNVGGTLQVGSSGGAVVNSTNSTINVTGNLDIIGSGVLNDNNSDFTIGGDFNNSGAVATTLTGNVDVAGNVNNDGSSNLTFGGTATVGGNLNGSGGTAVIVNGSLDVTGNIDLVGSAELNGSGVVGWGTFTTDNSGSAMECQDNSRYDAHAGTPEPTPPNNPFDLTTCGPGVILPVELLVFGGDDRGTYNYIYWTTVTEENNSHFIVEKSIDGINFYPIGQVEGNGNSQQVINYSFNDYDHASAYYRLQQVDFDGAYAYSNIIYIHVLAGSELTVYPNPTSGNSINVAMAGLGLENYPYSLHDITGHFLESGILDGENNEQTIYFSNTLATGVYVLSVYINGEAKHTSKSS